MTETGLRDLVLASHNAGKLGELRTLLADLPLRLRGAGEFGLDEPDETACTFVENALIKARHARSVRSQRRSRSMAQ